MPERAETKLEDPMAALERALIEQFLRERGRTLGTIDALPSADRRALLAAAAQYAAERLAEVDARAAYLHEIHRPDDPVAEKTANKRRTFR